MGPRSPPWPSTGGRGRCRGRGATARGQPGRAAAGRPGPVPAPGGSSCQRPPPRPPPGAGGGSAPAGLQGRRAEVRGRGAEREQRSPDGGEDQRAGAGGQPDRERSPPFPRPAYLWPPSATPRDPPGGWRVERRKDQRARVRGSQASFSLQPGGNQGPPSSVTRLPWEAGGGEFKGQGSEGTGVTGLSLPPAKLKPGTPSQGRQACV